MPEPTCVRCASPHGGAGSLCAPCAAIVHAMHIVSTSAYLARQKRLSTAPESHRAGGKS